MQENVRLWLNCEKKVGNVKIWSGGWQFGPGGSEGRSRWHRSGACWGSAPGWTQCHSLATWWDQKIGWMCVPNKYGVYGPYDFENRRGGPNMPLCVFRMEGPGIPSGWGDNSVKGCGRTPWINNGTGGDLYGLTEVGSGAPVVRSSSFGRRETMNIFAAGKKWTHDSSHRGPARGAPTPKKHDGEDNDHHGDGQRGGEDHEQRSQGHSAIGICGERAQRSANLSLSIG